MEEICSFLWYFLPAELAKNTRKKDIFHTAEGYKRFLLKP